MARGRLMQALPTGGAMVAVEAGEDEVAGLLSEWVSIAAVNSPGSLVLSGAEDEVARVVEVFAGRGRRTSWLRVSHAFHSALMEPMLEEFERVLGTLSWGFRGFLWCRASPASWWMWSCSVLRCIGCVRCGDGSVRGWCAAVGGVGCKDVGRGGAGWCAGRDGAADLHGGCHCRSPVAR
ncbi:acyltransferase domain-containing protein [Streptomyces sp. M19]